MSTDTPYLLSLCSKTPGLDRFLESTKEYFYGDKVSCIFDTYPGHAEKWKYVPRDLDLNRYIIFMDTDDVIMQRPFPEFRHDLYLAAENVKHRDTIWKRVIEETTGFEELMDEDVYNVGTFAMKVVTLYQFIDFMEQSGLMDSTPLSDQLLFNLFLRRHPKLSRVVDLSIFCPLFSNYFKGVSKLGGRWEVGGKIICAVHANGASELKLML